MYTGIQLLRMLLMLIYNDDERVAGVYHQRDDADDACTCKAWPTYE